MIEINIGIDPKDNKVIIDGKDITEWLQKIKIEKTPSTIPIAELELKSDKIKIVGDSVIIRDKELSEYTQEELFREIAKKFIKTASKI